LFLDSGIRPNVQSHLPDVAIQSSFSITTGLVRSFTVKEVKEPPPEEFIEYAGILCWDTTDKIGTNPRRIQEWKTGGFPLENSRKQTAFEQEVGCD
jgi:hypothetical protein